MVVCLLRLFVLSKQFQTSEAATRNIISVGWHWSSHNQNHISASLIWRLTPPWTWISISLTGTERFFFFPNTRVKEHWIIFQKNFYCSHVSKFEFITFSGLFKCICIPENPQLAVCCLQRPLLNVRRVWNSEARPGDANDRSRFTTCTELQGPFVRANMSEGGAPDIFEVSPMSKWARVRKWQEILRRLPCERVGVVMRLRDWLAGRMLGSLHWLRR